MQYTTDYHHGWGRITEYGSHEELLKHGGLYKEMFEIQAEEYK